MACFLPSLSLKSGIFVLNVFKLHRDYPFCGCIFIYCNVYLLSCFILQTCIFLFWISSVPFSRSVMSDSLRPHESQHARPPCPSPSPGVHSNSRPSSWWCHPAISSSVIPFSCPQCLPASESFPMSHLFAWGGQRTLKSLSVPLPAFLVFIARSIMWSDFIYLHAHKHQNVGSTKARSSPSFSLRCSQQPGCPAQNQHFVKSIHELDDVL